MGELQGAGLHEVQIKCCNGAALVAAEAHGFLLLQALWAVWVPSQLVNFAFVPRHLRIPWGTLQSTCLHPYQPI